MSIERRPIRVVVVDDHPMLREGTRLALEQAPDIEVVGVAADGPAALHLVGQHRPDVLLLDVRLPHMSGVEVAKRVRASYPEVAILVLTGYDDIGYTRALLQTGIRGHLGKTASADDIIAAVRAVAEGKTFLVSESARAALGSEPEPLTAREQEVLGLLAAGRRNHEIAQELGVSVKTVEFHITHLLEKLGARSRTEAILKARQKGLLLPEDNGSSAVKGPTPAR